MPSGSHRTSGGSHRSGGTRSSSSRSSVSSSRRTSTSHHRVSHHRGWRRGGVHINGHELGPVGSIIFFVCFLIFFSGAWLFAGIMLNNQRTAELKVVENDYIYYQDMITFAEQKQREGDSRFIIEGTITGKFESEYNNKWYLTYEFEYLLFPNTSSTLTDTVSGETYAVYNYEDIRSITPGSTILLATYDAVLSENTDTVNIDYKNTKLEDDGYYLHIKNGDMFPQILCFAVAGGSALLFIFLIFKQVKNLKGGSGNEIDEPQTEKSTPSLTKECPYCGATMASSKSKCPNCSATDI